MHEGQNALIPLWHLFDLFALNMSHMSQHILKQNNNFYFYFYFYNNNKNNKSSSNNNDNNHYHI